MNRAHRQSIKKRQGSNTDEVHRKPVWENYKMKMVGEGKNFALPEKVAENSAMSKI